MSSAGQRLQNDSKAWNCSWGTKRIRYCFQVFRKTRTQFSNNLLSDQAMCLWFIKKPAKYGRFSVLGCTFQGQKHGYKDFGVL